MALPIFQRITGDTNIRPFVKASGNAITAGDLVTLDDDAYNIIPAATDKLVLGIAMDTLGSASTADIRVDVLKTGPGGDEVLAKVATGTAAADEKGKFADIGSSSTGITLTESNNDCMIVGFPKAGYQSVIFTSGYPTVTTTVSD